MNDLIVKNRKRLVAIALLSSLCIVIALFVFAEEGRVIEYLRVTNGTYYLLSALVFLLVNLIVAARLYFFLHLSGIKKYLAAFDTGVSHVLLLNFLPLRLGDAIYPVLLKKFLQADLSDSLLNFIVLRLYDFITAVLLFLLMAILYLGDSVSMVFNAVLGLAFALAVILLLTLKISVRLMIRLLSAAVSIQLLDKLLALLQEIAVSIENVRLRDHMVFLVFTILSQVCGSVVILLIFKSLSIEISLVTAILLHSGMAFAFLVPVHTIGGIGLIESFLAFC